MCKCTKIIQYYVIYMDFLICSIIITLVYIKMFVAYF